MRALFMISHILLAFQDLKLPQKCLIRCSELLRLCVHFSFLYLQIQML